MLLSLRHVGSNQAPIFSSFQAIVGTADHENSNYKSFCDGELNNQGFFLSYGLSVVCRSGEIGIHTQAVNTFELLQ